jgi:uncharacterized protein (UPF0248 family)
VVRHQQKYSIGIGLEQLLLKRAQHPTFVDDEHFHPQRQFRTFITRTSPCLQASSNNAGDSPTSDGYKSIDERNSSLPSNPPASPTLTMENLYHEWSLEQDRLLWSNRDKSSAEIASLLGRGIRGSQARLCKLKDVSSPAYERLFVGKADRKKANENSGNNDDSDWATMSSDVNSKRKLIPVSEVLRRIEWDYSLDGSDFSILHYDRVDDIIVESPWDAPNQSISNTKEGSLVKALPEHRIVGIKYKERLVWDRSTRMDLFFCEPGIAQIVATYPEWKQEQDELVEYIRARREYVSMKMNFILGDEQFETLQSLSEKLLEVRKHTSVLPKKEVEGYVQRILEFFRAARNDPQLCGSTVDPSWIPQNDWLALDSISEFVSCWFQDDDVREMILNDISFEMDRLDGPNKPPSSSSSSATVNSSRTPATAIQLLDSDLEESFVRGSGPGGQKINKTSNRVVLIHIPTNLKVECQDTRSLQQNRKIARKRLQDKVDEYVNGSQSKVQMKQKKAADKRQKSKSKNKSRLKKKQEEKVQLLSSQQQPEQGQWQDYDGEEEDQT